MMRWKFPPDRLGLWLMLTALVITITVYWPGLSGGWLFDDYPNIVDNPGIQQHQINVAAMVRAAMSSPASEFKRPFASLSFMANYIASGLAPWSWKLFNLFVHLFNGVLVFLLARMLLRTTPISSSAMPAAKCEYACGTGIVAALIAAGWMLLPINLTAVLYVVQREETLANLFVLMGLIGYMTGRYRMLETGSLPSSARKGRTGWMALAGCTASIILPTALGVLAKETAAMLPLYAFLVEWIVFGFDRPIATGKKKDWRIAILFVIVLLLPLSIGLAWLAPSVLSAPNWATRNFTLGTRLLSEARIVCDYIAWTVAPTPHALSFYHDQFRASTGLLSPWTTLTSTLGLAALVALVFYLRHRQPLVALGIALFLGCHVLTGTILPLELVYEHRNYFASLGVMLVVVPLLAATSPNGVDGAHRQNDLPLTLLRRVLLACLLIWWGGLTAVTAHEWGDPLRLAQELATRAPDSPRAQYELGRTYIIYSHYDPTSPYTQLAYAPLEKAASLPNSSILPEQALLFLNARMHQPINDLWWQSMINKLKTTPIGIQDESALGTLTQCMRDQGCALSKNRMQEAYLTALAHPRPSARLLSMYGDFAWNILHNRQLGLRMTEAAVLASPTEPAYRITQIRMLVALGDTNAARNACTQLQALNVGGRLDGRIAELRALLK